MSLVGKGTHTAESSLNICLFSVDWLELDPFRLIIGLSCNNYVSLEDKYNYVDKHYINF
jgi:hypothetical protein